jgi:hypothetical protein
MEVQLNTFRKSFCGKCYVLGKLVETDSCKEHPQDEIVTFVYNSIVTENEEGYNYVHS